MAIKATTSTRAPQGTKALITAFLSAADDVPEARRADVIKAALAGIRDLARETKVAAKAAKVAVKAKAAKASPARGKKAAAAPAKRRTPAPAAKKPVPKPAKRAKTAPTTTDDQTSAE